ncbi:F-box only protein 43 [Esox lucius]|uniref:ZBR-type domain-containing protein n=1 Tax=Esox lucius TaxID=8010 RepID=A0A3P8XBJ1_ESOLU|nr:F-box only protein 43 [Esox lucius]XP_034153537.1 F-box only protein 43 [Esox lucius]
MESSFRPDAHFQSSKELQYGSCHDSGYQEGGYSPKLDSGVKYKPSKSFSSDWFYEMPKENLLQRCEPLLSPKKNKQKELVRSQHKDILKEQPLQNSWCDTPKLSKREISLRRRLLMSKSTTEGKTLDNTTTNIKTTLSSVNMRSEHGSNVVFDSPEAFSIGASATSTLKQEDLLLSGRKRRFLFSHVKTSTLDEDKCNVAPLSEKSLSGASLTDDLDESIISSDHLITEILETPSYCRLALSAKENFQTPVNHRIAANLSDSLSTPSFTPTKPHHDSSILEDSGFSSLAMDKSQDSSVDQDGSFQELLLSSGGSSGKEISVRVTEMTKRRSRLERQCRLSTLREGGSQSEEGDRVAKPQTARPALPQAQEKNPVAEEQPLHVLSKEDEVFLDGTPLKTATDKLEDLFLTPALQMVCAFSQRTSKMLLEQTSLEELLKASEQDALRTTMPLAGLIGRKMGMGKVDIFSELDKRNLRHILVMVLNHLAPEDIYRVGLVSNSWNEIISQNKMSSRKRRQYLKDVKASLELGSSAHVPDAETRLNLSSRSALRSVQAQSRTPSYTMLTPQSATGTSTLTPIQRSSASRQDAFIQVAKTLFSDECLRPCPRCQQPARCHSVKGEGACSRVDCGFRFCTGCLCAFHGSKECASLSAKRRGKKDLLPGSAQSKRNVRRL